MSLNVNLKWLKTFNAEDLLACLQELLNGDHAVMVLVHFLKNRDADVSESNLKAP